MIEALQQLKYSFREDRQSLDFVSHLQAKESDCGIDVKLSAYAIDELLSAKKWNEPWDLLRNSRPAESVQMVFTGSRFINLPYPHGFEGKSQHIVSCHM
jgi:hypothetical protein